MKSKKQENKKITLRDLKSKANEILSSRVIEELKADNKKKNSRLNLRGGGLVPPKFVLPNKNDEETLNSDDELNRALVTN